MRIHIDWQSDLTLDDAYELKGSEDYGVYQIYGSHPLYGSQTLLYIGKASSQTFGARLYQHTVETSDYSKTRVYVGRIGANVDEHESIDWDAYIDYAERLLIYAHQPARNAQNLKSANVPLDVHIMNWGDRGMLLPEVSGFRYLVSDAEYFPYYENLSDE